MATRRNKDSGSTGAAPAAKRRASTKSEAPAVQVNAGVSVEVRRGMIAEAAYLRAERRGFAPGSETDDWLAAEKEIDALLSAGRGARQ